MKSRDILIYSLVAVAAWLVFFRKTDKFCTMCAM